MSDRRHSFEQTELSTCMQVIININWKISDIFSTKLIAYYMANSISILLFNFVQMTKQVDCPRSNENKNKSLEN